MHINIANRPHQIFAPAKAEEFVAAMNADVDDDFEYRVRHDPKGTGGSVIEVYDEHGDFIELF